MVEVVLEEEDEAALAGQANDHASHRGGIGSLSQLCQADTGREYLLAITEWSGDMGMIAVRGDVRCDVCIQ